MKKIILPLIISLVITGLILFATVHVIIKYR